MYPMKMVPVYKDYLWGGTRLREEYGKQSGLAVVAESWEVSCHPDGPSTVANGVLAGKTLAEALAEHPEWMGSRCAGSAEFPLLIKLIDAKQDLSLQVHPGDEYACRVEGQQGKNEMWYVLHAEPGACLILGFERTVEQGEIRRRIQDNTLLEIVRRVPVQAGDCFCIPAGLLHAIGAGTLVAEVQQNSNVTYRVYDYGRRDGAGNLRELHVDRALDVIDGRLQSRAVRSNPLADWEYFGAELVKVRGQGELVCTQRSFRCAVVVEGTLEIGGGDGVSLRKGESVFLPAGLGVCAVSGTGTVLVTGMREEK